KNAGFDSQEMTRDEFIEFAYKIHIADLFENDELYESNFCCHFHSDRNPSANIAFNNKTDKYYYHCHSKCKKHARNIFQVVKEACNLKKFDDAVKKLAKVCNVKIVRTEFEIDQKFKYVSNQSFLFNLQSNAEEGEISKTLQKVLCTKTRLRVLEVLLQKAMSVVIKEEYSYKDEAVFFASLSHLADRLKLDRKIKAAVHKEIKMLLLLGILGRVPFEEVPQALQEVSLKIKEENQEYAKKQGDEREENVINYYFMQDFNDAIELAEERAQLMKDKSFKIKDHLNKTALISLFGEGIANEVFPDKRKIPLWAIDLSGKMKKKMAKRIKEKSYIVESDLLNNKAYKIKQKVVGTKEEVRKQVTVKEVERVYKNIILTDDEIGFTRVRINDDVRKEYGMTKNEKGYAWV
ncbi:CHC2 zinc finger domain-containing protein, partial [Bacillus mycoides]